VTSKVPVVVPVVPSTSSLDSLMATVMSSPRVVMAQLVAVVEVLVAVSSSASTVASSLRLSHSSPMTGAVLTLLMPVNPVKSIRARATKSVRVAKMASSTPISASVATVAHSANLARPVPSSTITATLSASLVRTNLSMPSTARLPSQLLNALTIAAPVLTQ